MKSRTTLRVAVRLLGPALLVLVLWRLSDPAALWRAVTQASPPLLALAVLSNLVPLHLRVERWRVLLRACGHSYPLGRAYRAMLTSLYLAMVTPGRIGDVLRVQYVRRELDTPYAEGLAVTAADRMCDVYMLAAFVALGLGHFAASLHGELAFVAWALVGASVLAPLLFFLPHMQRLLARLYARFAGDATGLEAFLASLRRQLAPALRAGIPLTVVAFVATYAQGWLVARALGLELGFADVVGLMAITNLLGLLPVSISGVGVRETFLALIFPALGLSPEHGVAFGLALFVALYLPFVIAGFIAWQVAPPPFDGPAAARDATRTTLTP